MHRLPRSRPILREGTDAVKATLGTTLKLAGRDATKRELPGVPLQEPELLTLPAAARRAGIGVRQIRRAVKCGELPVYQVGAWLRVRWVEVIRWICSQRVPTTSHARQRVAEVLEREAKKAHR